MKPRTGTRPVHIIGRQLSKYWWLFALDARLNDVFPTLVNHLGVEHHSYSAADLKTG